MYVYKSLIFDHYGKEPAALVIVTDKRPSDEPEYYSHKRYGTEIVYKYNKLVLLELDDEELLASDNPIDLILYAAKFARRAKKELQKFNFLRETVRLLGERGWSTEEKRDLLLFTERIVNMRNEKLIMQYREILEQESREGKAMYVPLLLRDSANEIEQRGMEKGIAKGMERGMERGMAKGIEKGKLEVARNLLARGVSPDIIAESAGVSLDQIQGLMN
jgi:predicted transposase/invertase (TIGR01784 family)